MRSSPARSGWQACDRPLAKAPRDTSLIARPIPTTPVIPARPELAGLDLADDPDRWRELGFELDQDRVQLGGIRLRLGRPGHGITAWTLRHIEAAEIDGLPTRSASAGEHADELRPRSGLHPNGALGIDHVVVVTPDFERTARALEAAGLPLSRIRQEGAFRQGFRRLGPAILELVDAGDSGRPRDRAARFWGLVVIVEDLESLALRLGERLGSIKPAVQPGRRIATLKASAGLTAAVAFMDPEPVLGDS